MTSPEKQAVLSADFQSTPVDSAHNRYPFCIVWCPLPLIGLFIPFIGHLGIADSKGIIYDFAGSYLIGKEFFAFGNPARYVQFPIHSVQQAREWDEAIAYGNAIYSERPHQICCDNCHSHVAACLNHLECSNSKSWNMNGDAENVASVLEFRTDCNFMECRQMTKRPLVIQMLG